MNGHDWLSWLLMKYAWENHAVTELAYIGETPDIMCFPIFQALCVEKIKKAKDVQNWNIAC